MSTRPWVPACAGTNGESVPCNQNLLYGASLASSMARTLRISRTDCSARAAI